MNTPLQSYNIPADFLQAIVDNLDSQPSKNTRMLLNYIDKLVIEQQEKAAADKAAADKAAAEKAVAEEKVAAK